MLLVGREYERKGVDIAIQVVEQLNEKGVSTQLIVCGVSGVNRSHVEFVGPYRKSDPAQLQAYTNLYRQAHFLIHPAKFEAAGIVPSEAAAFGYQRSPMIQVVWQQLSKTVFQVWFYQKIV